MSPFTLFVIDQFLFSGQACTGSGKIYCRTLWHQNRSAAAVAKPTLSFHESSSAFRHKLPMSLCPCLLIVLQVIKMEYLTHGACNFSAFLFCKITRLCCPLLKSDVPLEIKRFWHELVVSSGLPRLSAQVLYMKEVWPREAPRNDFRHKGPIRKQVTRIASGPTVSTKVHLILWYILRM
jgi:hypothetical protein